MAQDKDLAGSAFEGSASLKPPALLSPGDASGGDASAPAQFSPWRVLEHLTKIHQPVDRALAVARCGLAVVPCVGKHPILEGLGKGTGIAGTRTGSWHEASTRPEKIRQMWTRQPGGAVGLGLDRLPRHQGFIVLDPDTRNGGDQTLAKLLAEHGPLPDTLTIRSGGPSHDDRFVFRLPAGLQTRKAHWQPFGPGLDVLGDGGGLLLCGPHPTTSEYTTVTRGIPPADAPLWLAEAACEPIPGDAAAARRTVSARVLAKAVATIEAARRGQRDDTIRSAACAVGRLTGLEDGLDADDAEKALWRACEACGWVDDQGEQEARDKLRRHLNDGRDTSQPWRIGSREAFSPFVSAPTGSREAFSPFGSSNGELKALIEALDLRAPGSAQEDATARHARTVLRELVAGEHRLSAFPLADATILSWCGVSSHRVAGAVRGRLNDLGLLQRVCRDCAMALKRASEALKRADMWICPTHPDTRQADLIGGQTWLWRLDVETKGEERSLRKLFVMGEASSPFVSATRWEPGHDCWLGRGEGLRELLTEMEAAGGVVEPAALVKALDVTPRTIRNRLALLRTAGLVVPVGGHEELAQWAPGELQRLAEVRDSDRKRKVTGRHQEVVGRLDEHRVAWRQALANRQYNFAKAAEEGETVQTCAGCGGSIPSNATLCDECDF